MSIDQADGPDDPREQQVQTVVEEFVAQLQAGRQPDRDEFVLAHESLAGALESRLEAAELLHRLAAGDPAPAPLPPRPETIGRYRIDDTLGAGAFAVVYQAYDPKFQRAVALKVLRCDGSDAGKRSDRDAQIVGRLRHPNIVPLHDTGEADGLRFLDMELIRGPDVEKALKRRDGQRLPPAEAAELVFKIATALDYAHQAGVVHRDVKTTNILIDEHGEPQLTDFGLARGSESASLTVAGQLIGTPAFMSPEQAAGRGHEADARSDVYSLGVVLFRLLTGRLPFADDGSIAALLGQIISRDPPRPCDLVADLPRDLQTICLKAMEKSPADRFQTAGAFADELRRWRQEEPLTIRPPTRLERLRRWAKRHRAVARVLTGAAVVLLAVTAVAGWTVWVQREQRFEARTQAETARQRERLETEKRAEVEAWNLASAARQRLATPSGGRRREAQAILRDAAALCHQVPAGPMRERLALVLRSIYASTLGVPELEVEDSGATLPEVFYAAWPTTIHPGGEAAVIGTPDGPLRWVRGRPLTVPPGLKPNKPRPRLAFTPDGQRLAFAPAGGGLQLWDETASHVLAELEPASSSPVLAIGFDSGAATVWACRADGTVTAWSWKDYRPADGWHLSAGEPPLEAARFSDDAAELAVGTDDGRVLLLRRGEAEPVRELKCGRFPVTALAWSADKQLVAVGTDDGSVQLWHADGRPGFQHAPFGEGPSSLQFTPDGQYLLAGGRASNLYVWEVGTGAQVLTGRSPPSGFAADGRRFAGGDGSRVSICTLLTPQALRDLSGHRASPTRLAWSGDSRRLASLDFRSEVRVWDVDRGLPLGAFDVPRGTFYSPNAAIALSDDGSLLGYASGGKDAVAVLADASTGKELDRWPLPTGFERMVYAGGRFLLLREEETHAGKFDWQTVAREFGPDHSPADSMRIVRPAVAGEVDFHTSGLTADGRFYWWIGPRRPPANMRAEVREIATGRLVKSVPIPQVQEAQTWDGFVTPDGGELWLIGQGGWTAHDLTGARPSEPRAPGPFGWALGSGWELVSNLSQEMRGTPALTIRRAGGPMWLELMSRDLAGISGACFSPDGRRAAWGSGHSTVSIIDLPLLQREVGEFERLLPQ